MIPELRMRERKQKKEWIEAANWVSVEWLSVSQPQGSRNRGREAKSTKTKWSETKCEERWAYVLAFEWNWAEVGFRNKSNDVFYTFFFLISAWIGRFGRYGRFRPESARFRANWPESKPRRHDSAKITWNPHGTMRQDALVAASPTHRRISPLRTQVRHLRCRVLAS